MTLMQFLPPDAHLDEQHKERAKIMLYSGLDALKRSIDKYKNKKEKDSATKFLKDTMDCISASDSSAYDSLLVGLINANIYSEYYKRTFPKADIQRINVFLKHSEIPGSRALMKFKNAFNIAFALNHELFVKYIQNTVIYTRNQLPASITNVYSNVTRALHVKLPEAHNALILISRTHNKNQTVHVLENWDPNPNGPLSVDQAPLNTDFWFFDDGFNPDPPS